MERYPIKILDLKTYNALLDEISFKQVIGFIPKFIELGLDHFIHEDQIICEESNWKEFVNGS